MDPIDRREALRRLSVFSLSTLLPLGALACSKKPSCLDVSGLSPDDAKQRSDVAAYSEQSMDAARRCALCAQYVAAAPDACGSCKVVKGPINPDATCKLFVPKAT